MTLGLELPATWLTGCMAGVAFVVALLVVAFVVARGSHTRRGESPVFRDGQRGGSSQFIATYDSILERHDLDDRDAQTVFIAGRRQFGD